MSTTIFVGNLPFNTNADEISELFSTFSTVETVNLITARDTGHLRGFGFVEMSSGWQEAIDALHQSDFGGRSLTVNMARPREERPPRDRR